MLRLVGALHMDKSLAVRPYVIPRLYRFATFAAEIMVGLTSTPQRVDLHALLFRLFGQPVRLPLHRGEPLVSRNASVGRGDAPAPHAERSE